MVKHSKHNRLQHIEYQDVIYGKQDNIHMMYILNKEVIQDKQNECNANSDRIEEYPMLEIN